MADHVPPSEQSELYVAIDMETWEAHPPIEADQDEICEESGFRRLDPQYYAWLRYRMEKAKRGHGSGELNSGLYEVLRQRFNTVHSWALRRFGEAPLLAAVKELDPERYRPPRVGCYDVGPLPVGLLDPPMGPFRFSVRTTRLARAKVDLIRERAIALGWTPAQLYQNCGRLRFPLDGDYGLACFLRHDDEITNVTAHFIEITSARGVRNRVYRPVRGRE